MVMKITVVAKGDHDYDDTEYKDEYPDVLSEVGEDQGDEGPTNVLLPLDATRAPRDGSRAPSCGNLAPVDVKHAPKDAIHAPSGGTGGRPHPDRPRCRCPGTSARANMREGLSYRRCRYFVELNLSGRG